MSTLLPWRPARALVPLVPAYGAAVLARRWLYDVGWLRTRASPLPTICVGGLEAGGSGKTPVTAWLLSWLLQQGHRPGLLTRGYGRPRRAPATLRPAGAGATAAALGDEAAMLVASGLDVAVAANPRRIVGARALAAAGCTAIVMDDGFAHRALRRHLDVVVLRGDAPVGRGGLLPAGTLREPPSSLRRAHIVWLHDKEDAAPNAEPLWAAGGCCDSWRAWRRWCPDASVVRSRAQYTLTDVAGHPVALPMGPVVAASGVAHPGTFHRALARLGAAPARCVVFDDHHRYSAEDVQYLQETMTQCAASALVVTAKDAVKLRELWPSQLSLRVLQARVQIIDGMTQLVTAIKSVLKQ